MSRRLCLLITNSDRWYSICPHLIKRSLDAALESPSLEVAYELEERAQMLMLARR